MTKTPDGFPTWLSFWDYLQAEKPDLLKAKSIHFMQYTPNGVVEAYKISIRTLKQKCWEEIEKFRLTPEESIAAMDAIIMGNADIRHKSIAINFLKKSQRIFSK